MKRRGFFADTAPLQSTDFRRLWASGIVTIVGASLTVFAVPVQIYALTQNSAYVGLSGVFALVPLVVFGLLGVQQAFYAVNVPTRAAAVPRMVPESQLAAANR